MPIPKPKNDEKQSEFISRCMGDDVMKEEYKDEKQRLAVCFSSWNKEKKSLEKPSDDELAHAMQEARAGNIEALISWVAQVGFTACVDALSDKPGITDPEKVCGWLKAQSKSGIRQVERRYSEPDIEFREENGVKKIVGHFAPFNKLSKDLGGFREKVAPGAFLATIEEAQSNKDDPIYGLWNHNSDKPLATTAIPYPEVGALRLYEDDKGGAYEMILGDTTWSRDAHIAVREKLVRHNSFAFVADEEEWDNEKKIRILKKVKLFDVSLVTYPAYPHTNVTVRMDEKDKEDIVNRIIRSSQPKPNDLDIQGAEDLEPGRVDSLDILRKRLDVADKS